MEGLPKEKYGLWITDLIRYADLTVAEKFLLADIVTICNNGENRYFKINQTISDMMRVNVKTVSRILNSLEQKNLINRSFSNPYSGNVKTKRVITPIYSSIRELKIDNNSKI